MFGYPIFLELRGRPVLVVGGGQVAERRVERLLRAGAQVQLVAPQVTDALAALAERGQLRWHARPFRPEDVAPELALVLAGLALWAWLAYVFVT